MRNRSDHKFSRCRFRVLPRRWPDGPSRPRALRRTHYAGHLKSDPDSGPTVRRIDDIHGLAVRGGDLPYQGRYGELIFHRHPAERRSGRAWRYEIGPRLKVESKFKNLPRGVRCNLARRSTTEHNRLPQICRTLTGAPRPALVDDSHEQKAGVESACFGRRPHHAPDAWVFLAINLLSTGATAEAKLCYAARDGTGETPAPPGWKRTTTMRSRRAEDSNLCTRAANRSDRGLQ